MTHRQTDIQTLVTSRDACASKNRIMIFVLAIKMIDNYCLADVHNLVSGADDDDDHDQEHEHDHKCYQGKSHDHNHDHTNNNGDDDNEDSSDDGHDLYHEHVFNG